MEYDIWEGRGNVAKKLGLIKRQWIILEKLLGRRIKLESNNLNYGVIPSAFGCVDKYLTQVEDPKLDRVESRVSWHVWVHLIDSSQVIACPKHQSLHLPEVTLKYGRRSQ